MWLWAQSLGSPDKQRFEAKRIRHLCAFHNGQPNVSALSDGNSDSMQKLLFQYRIKCNFLFQASMHILGMGAAIKFSATKRNCYREPINSTCYRSLAYNVMTSCAWFLCDNSPFLMHFYRLVQEDGIHGSTNLTLQLQPSHLS